MELQDSKPRPKKGANHGCAVLACAGCVAGNGCAAGKPSLHCSALLLPFLGAHFACHPLLCCPAFPLSAGPQLAYCRPVLLMGMLIKAQLMEELFEMNNHI